MINLRLIAEKILFTFVVAAVGNVVAKVVKIIFFAFTAQFFLIYNVTEFFGLVTRTHIEKT